MDEDFKQRDAVTGKKLRNVLNRKVLNSYEMDEIFGECINNGNG